jgi:hypothetical protein
VGAPGTADGAGAAYLWDGSLEIVAAGEEVGDGAGAALALNGAWYVGVPHAGERQRVATAELGTGLVMADGETWEGEAPGDCFGRAVAVDGERLLAGAPCRGSYEFVHESLPRPMLVDGPGAAFLYGETRASYAGNEAWDALGHSVGFLNDLVVLGAPDYFGGDWINQLARGEVHLFAVRDGEFTIADAASTIVGGQGGRELHDDHGWAFAAGDLDDDADDELVVGAPSFDDFERQGGGWIFFDTPAGEQFAWDGEVALAGEPQAGITARTGTSIAIGDVSCDGIPDLVFGAPLRTTDADRAGAVYVTYGPFETWTPLAEADLILEGRGLGARAGTSVATTDVDGDGCDEIVLGAPGATGGVGAVYVVSAAPATS